MRIAIASFGQETSSFSPLPTTLETFALYGLYRGDEIREKCRGVGALGGFFSAMEEAGEHWTPLPIVHGWAGASGPLTAEALAFFEETIREGLQAAGPIDAFFFALHGAAAAGSEPDTEGHLLAMARQTLGKDVPVVISLDHHANVTQCMVDNVDGLVGHRTQPHDQFETGHLAGGMLLSLMHGETKPTIGWRKIPLITHQEQFLTSHGPMKAWFDQARRMEERPGVISASTFPMQPWLDVPEGGWATVVVTDGDPDLAERLAVELADGAWSRRREFCRLDSISPAAAVQGAAAAERGLVVLTDTGDSTFGGATGDSVCLLREMIAQKIGQTALVPVVDAEVVDAALAAGVGATIEVTLGGKLDPVFGEPLAVTATVGGFGGGRFDLSMLGFESFDTGKAVLLEIGAIRVVVSEKRGIGGNHPIVYEQFGLDVGDAHMVVVKTASNWQFFGRWISEVIRVDTPGATTSHLERLDWQHLPRPIYPLDELPRWEAAEAGGTPLAGDPAPAQTTCGDGDVASRPDGTLDHLLEGESFYSNPYPAFARMRAEAPVYWHRGGGTWLITRYDDVETVFRSPKVFSSYGFQNAYFENLRPELRNAAPTLELRGRTPTLITSDPPDHSRLRRLLQVAFSPRVMKDLQPRIELLVEDLLEAVVDEETIDFVSALAYPLPAMIIADIMGVPREQRDLFKQVSRNIVHFMARNNPNTELTVDFAREADGSLARLRESLRGLMEERRSEPRDDVISALVGAEFEGDRLAEEELLANLVLFLVAGHETTTNLIANGIMLLLRHPEQLKAIRENREMLAPAIEEILRFEAPVQRNRRVVAQDTEFGGVKMHAGEPAEVVIGSANRDETKWSEPDRFDIEREPLPNLAFGKTIHFCIGASLARLEATVAFTELLDRFAKMELPEGWKPTWATTTNLRTLHSLPVKV